MSSHFNQMVGAVAVAVSLAVLSFPAHGQLTVSGSATYTQNFDSLAGSGATAWVDNSTLSDWFAAQSSGAVSGYDADDGSSSAGGLRSYGSTGSPGRALGSLNRPGATANLAYGVVFQNTGTTPLTIQIQYDGEWWRDGNKPVPESLEFTYKTSATSAEATSFDGSSPTAAGFVRFAGLDFDVTGDIRGSGARDGNADAKTILGDLSGVLLNPGEYLSLRWFEDNALGNDDGLALDNLSVTFAPMPVPEPVGVVWLAAAGVAFALFARRPVV